MSFLAQRLQCKLFCGDVAEPNPRPYNGCLCVYKKGRRMDIVASANRIAKELSGAAWVARFPTSVAIGDLDDAFESNVNSFKSAAEGAGASISIEATKRPAERAYLMHWSWKIVKANQDPKTIPSHAGVEIEWWHGDQAKSVAGATEMVSGYGIQNLGVAPALNSRHIEGKAIDMAITWNGTLKIKKKNGTEVSITSTPRTSENADLITVGASYDVVHFSPPASDRNHWSTDGH